MNDSFHAQACSQDAVLTPAPLARSSSPRARLPARTTGVDTKGRSGATGQRVQARISGLQPCRASPVPLVSGLRTGSAGRHSESWLASRFFSSAFALRDCKRSQICTLPHGFNIAAPGSIDKPVCRNNAVSANSSIGPCVASRRDGNQRDSPDKSFPNGHTVVPGHRVIKPVCGRYGSDIGRFDGRRSWTCTN